MAAPTFVAAGSYLTEASGSSAAIAVPAGVAVNDIILVELYKETTVAVTPPTGFTEKSHQATTGTEDHDSYVFWKRLTAADTGTYTFSWSTAAWRTGFATAWRGCVTTGDPVDVFAGATSGSTAVTTSPAVSVTTTGPDRLLVWFGATWDVTAWTTPSGFTASVPSDAPATRLTHDGYLAQPVAGPSGTVQTTTTQNFTKTAHLLALTPATRGGVWRNYGQARRRAALI